MLLVECGLECIMSNSLGNTIRLELSLLRIVNHKSRMVLNIPQKARKMVYRKSTRPSYRALIGSGILRLPTKLSAIVNAVQTVVPP